MEVAMEIRRLKTAAAKGDPLAQFNLGIIYNRRLDDNGYPASSDRAEALKWLSAAAKHGLPRAQIHVAELLCESTDMAEWIEACAWLIRAQANNLGVHHERATKSLALVSAALTSNQIVDARHMAETFKSEERYVPQVVLRRRRR
jgi:TPR repeat protein